MSRPPLDQKSWQALTTWADAATPTYPRAWALLTDGEMPPAFRDLVASLKHPFLRKLQLAASASEPSPALTMEPRTWNNRFANLVSGRFTELLFHQTYAAAVAAKGLSLTETTGEHDWLDYLLVQPGEGFALGINVKNAGVQFDGAQSWVGLAPDDTLPIATYKIFGSTAKEGHIPLVYVYLVDWTLLPRLRAAYWDSLNDAERAVFQLMTSFKGLPRKLEDRLIECTVAERLPTLWSGVGYDEDSLPGLPFRAISGRRCQRIFYVNHGRAPYVYVRKMNTDPNVHISVTDETLQFGDFIEQWLGSPETRAKLLAGLSTTELLPIPDPPV